MRRKPVGEPYRRVEMDMEAKIVGGKRESVAKRLERHPELRARVERLLDVVEDTAGDVRQAD